MFDTHCHLNFDDYKEVLDKVVSDAKTGGVTRILAPGVDIKSSRRALEISGRYPSLYAAVGIHPTVELKEEYLDSLLNEIENLAMDDKVLAIGEIGLDFYKHKSPSRVQKLYFQKQLELAAKLGKSVVIHNRHSSEALLEVLNECWSEALSGATVFHCVEPDEGLLNFAKNHKVYLGFDGDITYSKDKQDFIKEVPLNLIVVETDSPFLTPLPIRKGRVKYNEPKYLPAIVKKISELLGIKEDKLANKTTENALNLFDMV